MILKMSNLIIADTSSLIALDKINLLELLKIIYNEIYITPEVFDEYKTNLPNWITIKRVIDIDKIRELNIGLDIGEASSKLVLLH
jgi:predicted nucleic acid-binding protein